MIEGLIFGTIALVFAAVIGLLGAVISCAFWLLALPFKLLALTFKGIGLLLALPFIILFGILGVVLGGFGFVLLFIPMVPLLLIAMFFWWLIKGASRPATGH